MRDSVEEMAREFWGNLHKLSGPQDIAALLRSRDERALRIVEEVYREYGAKSIDDEDLAHGAETACREIKRRLEESDG